VFKFWYEHKEEIVPLNLKAMKTGIIIFLLAAVSVVHHLPIHGFFGKHILHGSCFSFPSLLLDFGSASRLPFSPPLLPVSFVPIFFTAASTPIEYPLLWWGFKCLDIISWRYSLARWLTASAANSGNVIF
jgi:hypothetical protein